MCLKDYDKNTNLKMHFINAFIHSFFSVLFIYYFMVLCIYI